ncbi:MAG TPA: D-2-hydroxyacid dehydrogenase [Candidatus Limnocylindrales bacterium]|nr:D-2-hydroxyacid dehydrogenase [Candidatus Limnocylindrales bacterium]
MSDRAGPGSGSGGAPAAIAISPILSARYRGRDLAAIREAAPEARIVNVSLDGHADGDLADVEVLLRGPMPASVFDRLIARCPRLAWVHSATAGVERVLTDSARSRGLVITNARGVFSRPIAEYVLMMMLAVSRRLPQLLELQQERTWQPLEALEMRDVTVGIVGYGSIGRAVASLATAFGCRVLATRRRSGDDSGPVSGGDELPPAAGDEAPLPVAPQVELLGGDELPRLLGESDFVVLALPLTADTADLFDHRLLAHMKPTAWLINVARGRLVDERALVRALREGRIGGAVLDTFRDEPLPPDSPLYEAPNLILTPHTSWSSGRVLDRSIELFCENLRRFARGEPLRNVVDPELGY